jgi:hypothetical protein
MPTISATVVRENGNPFVGEQVELSARRVGELFPLPRPRAKSDLQGGVVQ